jgi:hypothetical protein
VTGDWLSGRQPVHLAADARPQLFVIVDTEEQFDWSGPLRRDAVDVSATAEVWRLQNVLSPYGVAPTYVIDFPVATDRTASATLQEIAHRGECSIGAHLHPWVNPPFTESLGSSNSYACNLGADVEREKIRLLQEAIVEHLDVEPKVYKAGRYGFGTSSADTIEALDFDIDASVNPRMDFSSDGGPSFERFDAAPFVFGRARRLLELPCTTGFTGIARRFGVTLHRTASSAWLRTVRAVGVLSRSGLLNRVMLSPEGSTFDEMRSLTDALYLDGVRTFALTFHSPSLKPGCTPYVRTDRDRDALLATIDAYCEFFLGARGGIASTPMDFYRTVCNGR